MSTLRAGATPPDGGGEADSEAVEAERKAIEEGAAAAKALMDATDEFRAKQVRHARGRTLRLCVWVLLLFLLALRWCTDVSSGAFAGSDGHGQAIVLVSGCCLHLLWRRRQPAFLFKPKK